MFPYNDERNITWYIFKGFYGKQDIFPFLYTAHLKNISFWSTIKQSYHPLFLFAHRLFETIVTSLIDNRNHIGVYTRKLHYVTFRAFTYCNNMLRFITSYVEFILVDFYVKPVIILRETQKNQVMDSNYPMYSSLTQTFWKFS